MVARTLQVLGIWALVSTAGFGLLRLLNRVFTVPGAYAGVDMLLAALVSLPIAVMTATTVVVVRHHRGNQGKRWFSGHRATALAAGALALEGALIAVTDLLHPAVLITAVFIMWLIAMTGAGARLAEIFGTLE